MNNLKKLRLIKNTYDRGLKRVHKFSQKYFGQTKNSIVIFAKILVAFVMTGLAFGYTFNNELSPIIWSIGLFVVGYIIASLITLVLSFIVYSLKRVSPMELIAIAVIGYVFYILLHYTNRLGDLTDWQMGVSIIICTFVQWLFIRSLWAVFGNKKYEILTFLALITTTALNIGLIYFLSFEGFVPADKEIMLEDFLLDSKQSQITIEGRLTPSYMDYGQGTDIPTERISLTSYASYDGMGAKLRDFYWKRDLTNVPVSGRIWYPYENDNSPVLFIVHGNHRMTEENHLGYDFLGKYLAANGYVTVSVDQNMLNGFMLSDIGNENDARGVLLLENIRAIINENGDEYSPLYNKIDTDQIVIAGHSRGGEAASIAAYFNEINFYPDGGNRKFDFGFNISGVINIAPTVGQYEPAGHEIVLEDIDYLLIHGSHDQDINRFEGLKQYDNILFNEDSENFKSAVYVAYANHGQFNSRWGRYDVSQPLASLLNVADIMEEEDQQEILCEYILNFLNSSIKNSDRSLFNSGISNYQSIPRTLYYSQYSDSTLEVINNFEEDADIESTTLEGGQNSVDFMFKWREDLVTYHDKKRDTGNHALNLVWKSNNSKYSTLLSQGPNDEINYLQFDVKNNSLELDRLNFEVELVDINGESVSLDVKDYKTIYPGLSLGLLKLQHVFNNLESRHEFQTVRIPLDDFIENNGNFSRDSIMQVNFLFTDTEDGDIYLDNIGFAN